MNGCDKQAFDSEHEASAKLRLWQQRGRRKALDNAHPYKADCNNPFHRGKFHIGRKHDTIKRTPNPHRDAQERRTQIIGELDDLFDQQEQRIGRVLSRAAAHMRAQRLKNDEGPLVRAESTPYSGAGDSIHVATRK